MRLCGIAAVFAYGAEAEPVRRDEVESVTRCMAKRGPDAHGTWFSDDGRVGLGNRRLAIIDLSNDARQPMTTADGDLVIVFNGEIYNHRALRERLQARGVVFRTTSDTEVLLQMYRRYREEMVELLRGMFAFAIWDSVRRELFVARDPYGIKPLYVADDGRTFRAASQVKALLAGGRVSAQRDDAAAAAFLTLGSVPEPLTIRKPIRAVEAGTCFFVGERGRVRERRYFAIDATFRHAEDQRSIASLVEPSTLLREAVSESMGEHLVSDVPVGVFLSAGIDSTTLTALASERYAAQLSTVTLEPDLYEGGPNDEAPVATRFAKLLGTRHATRRVTREEFLSDLPRIFEAMDQPSIDGVNTWFVAKAAAEQGLKVAISGLGGDELFGSYPAFRAVSRLMMAARVPLGTSVVRLATRGNPKARFVHRYGASIAGAYLLQRGLYMPDELPSVIGKDETSEAVERLDIMQLITSNLSNPPASIFGRVATLEASLYMRNQLLRDTDWASMAHSLEVRTPLVDATLLRQIAPLLLRYGSKCKSFFADAPEKPLPIWLKERAKRGFVVPLKEWLDLPADGTSTRMRSWARLVLNEFK